MDGFIQLFCENYTLKRSIEVAVVKNFTKKNWFEFAELAVTCLSNSMDRAIIFMQAMKECFEGDELQYIELWKDQSLWKQFIQRYGVVEKKDHGEEKESDEWIENPLVNEYIKFIPKTLKNDAGYMHAPTLLNTFIENIDLGVGDARYAFIDESIKWFKNMVTDDKKWYEMLINGTPLGSFFQRVSDKSEWIHIESILLSLIPIQFKNNFEKIKFYCDSIEGILMSSQSDYAQIPWIENVFNLFIKDQKIIESVKSFFNETNKCIFF